MATSGLAHFTHDGFTDMLYIFFPIWQAQFNLAFAEVGLFKMLFSGTLAFFQVPSSYLARRVGVVRMLLAGTLLTSGAAVAYGWASTPFVLGCLLVIGGLGASVQHPLSSSLLSDAFHGVEQRRTALSIFNVSGDIGKLVFPASAALLIGGFGWQPACRTMGLFGIGVTVLLAWLARSLSLDGKTQPATGVRSGTRTSILSGNRAFGALLGIGILDSATRMGFLTYFPFLLQDKGAGIAVVGLALSLIFSGGIAGKFVCGILATRIGVLRSVLITECLTGVCIWAVILMPLHAVLVLCPILGVALNGTSSVLYGSVPELVAPEQRPQSFAIFYTATIGSGALSPLLFGVASDVIGLAPTVIMVGALIFATIPLTLPLRGKLAG
ncbi:MAG: MFS transporter [Syntrophobacter sp.]